MRRFRFRRTTLIMLGLAGFLGGLGLARLDIRISTVWVCLGLLILIAVSRRKNLVLATFICAFGILAGLWRGGQYMNILDRYNEFYGQKIVVVGTATDDAVYGDRGQLTFDVNSLEVVSPQNVSLVGKIGVKGFGETAVYRGDRVQLEGKLFKTRGSRSGSISFAELNVQSRSKSPVNDIRRRFMAGMQSALPEPLASFGLGLLIGQRSTLPESFTLVLATVGLTHVVAVSGYNLMIIIRGVRRVVKKIKLSKYQSTIISLLLILLFLLLTGFSPSIVRAAIVSMLSLIAWYYGRSIRPLLVILLAAVLTAGFYPIYLWSDIGWYLSFLAFFGVLIIAPLLAKRFIKTKTAFPFKMLLLETFSAQLMTWPLIMYIFGEFSIIALLANILIVPFVAFAMLLSVIAGLGGMLIPQLAGWVAWPARLLLTYMVDIMQLLAKVPHALAHGTLIWWQMVLLYSLLMIFTLTLWRKTKRKNVILTDEEMGII